MKPEYYKYFHLYWFIPLFLLGLTIHQYAVYQGIHETYEDGTSYTAEVIAFETKQIVTQNSTTAVLEFTTNEGEQIRKKLSLPVEITGQIAKSEIIPIRYDPDSFQPIIIISAYQSYLSMTLFNVAVAGVGMLITLAIGWWVNRWIRIKQNEPEERKLIIDQIKTADH